MSKTRFFRTARIMVRTIIFVAIGNSLTVGSTSPGLANQSYSRFLMEIANDFLKKTGKSDIIEIRITNRGVDGDLTHGMLQRIQQDVINFNPDYVIILGGTNDIGWGLPVKEIFSNLKKMFEMAIDNGIEPIGCTVPSILIWDEGIPPRLKLNQLLKGFCSERGIICVDLFIKTCNAETGRLRSDYSSDGLHFNTLGYKKIAETIFDESIKNLLIRELNKS
ncbi:hypothetical protein KAX03_01925 [Candidatus Bathyarchaeota archaeon]|nr:hypothetical protein [Candidatus Bathyarchaeota archaeon]